tara:strand:- start:743 stop:853 length:111 start_codon:yes stop_codon:yes gene_type:complete
MKYIGITYLKIVKFMGIVLNVIKDMNVCEIMIINGE